MSRRIAIEVAESKPATDHSWWLQAPRDAFTQRAEQVFAQKPGRREISTLQFAERAGTL